MIGIKIKLQKLFRMTIDTFIICILIYITIAHFFLLAPAIDYMHIPKHYIPNELYKDVMPHIQVFRSFLPECSYHLTLANNVTEDVENIPNIIKNVQLVRRNLLEGTFMPDTCNPLFSVAIIVPYRDRQKQLDVFLPYIHSFLMKQQINYKLFLIEQKDDFPFNRGFLLNVGAKMAIQYQYPCLILHDVDLLPLDYSNLYVCTHHPRHMSARIDAMRYVLPYESLIGGALAIRADQFIDLNGFSNKFDDWGGEDDEFYERIVEMGLHITRYPPEMSRYSLQRHAMQPRNSRRWDIRAQNRKMKTREGLDDVFNIIDINDIDIKEYPLFTKVVVKRKHGDETVKPPEDGALARFFSFFQNTYI